MNRNEKTRVIIYSILFAFVMLVDQRTFTAMDHGRAAFVQAAILPFLILMIMQMKKEKIRKIGYRVYILIGTSIFLISSVIIYQSVEFYWQYILLTLEVILYFFVLIYGVNNRKEFFLMKVKKNWVFILWTIILFFMCVSQYNGYWNWFVLIVFVPLTMLNISKEEQKKIFLGLLFGIMTSYVLIQGYAFVFRPYDIARYQGSFNNPNRNSLFYTLVLTAFLINDYRLSVLNKRKLLHLINSIFLTSVIGFSILTGCKTGALTELIILLLYFLIKVTKYKEAIAKKVIKEAMVWIVMIILVTPLCYISARYIPPIFHHSVWFYAEYSERRVHSFDSYDSDKYPDLDVVVEQAIGRYSIVFEIFDSNEDILQKGLLEDTNTNDYALSDEVKEGVNEEIIVKDERELGELAEATVLEEKDLAEVISEKNRRERGQNTFSARLFIWKEYLTRLNLFGHEKISAMAHNVFVEFLYYYGIVFGGLFTLGYIVTGVVQLVRCFKEKTWISFGILSFFAIFGIYGMAEINWFPGQASLSLFLFMICFMVWDSKEEKIYLEKEAGDVKL